MLFSQFRSRSTLRRRLPQRKSIALLRELSCSDGTQGCSNCYTQESPSVALELKLMNAIRIHQPEKPALHFLP
jgi:hypothetical protein